MAYAPLGSGTLVQGDEDVVGACSRVGMDVPLALLRWGVQRGLCVVYTSSKLERISCMQPAAVLAQALPGSLQIALDACDTQLGKVCWDPKDVL